MSRAINTANPKYSKLTIGVCPDQWGVWFPADPEQMDPRRAWGEMAEAGFEVIETGPRFQAAFNREVQEWINAVARDEHTGSTAWDGYAATAPAPDEQPARGRRAHRALTGAASPGLLTDRTPPTPSAP